MCTQADSGNAQCATTHTCRSSPLIEADKEEIAAVIRFLLDKGEIQMEDGMLQTKILLLQITKK
jgi:hypothetical protein